MDSHSKITQRHPSTGANPSEQTAENAKNVKQQGRVQGIDELLYKLVENNVAYAGEQFGENLRFNSEVLTNVLYDNIKKLVGDKFEAEDFANWLADELIKNGYILKATTPPVSEQEAPKPNEEIVYTIDEKDYQDLLDKINATLVLIQTNRDAIQKRLVSLDDQVKDLGNNPIDTQSEIMSRRDKQIQELIDRIKSNQENVETYVQNRTEIRQRFAERVLGLNKKVDEFSANQERRRIEDEKLSTQTKELLNRVGKNWSDNQKLMDKLEGQIQDLGKKQELEKSKSSSPSPSSSILPKPPHIPSKQGRLGKSIVPSISNKISKKGKGNVPSFGGKLSKIFRKSPLGGNLERKLKKSPRKPSLVSRIKRRISFGARKLKNKISNSFIGKTYRAVVKTVKFVFNVIKGVAKAVKATAIFAWKSAKFVTKTFFKAAKFTGKVVKAVGKSIVSGAKKVVKLAKSGNLLTSVLSIAPGAMVVKFGWKAVKFVGKSIWKGIKKLAFKALSFFGSLFGLMGKFINKIGHWIGILAHGISDKTYRFIIKPIASMMVTIFNFVSSIVLSPIQFIKWLIPTIVDKIMGVIHSISQVVKSVLKSTYSIFKKILMHPITIALLVGGLFFLLWKWLGPKLSGGIEGIKNNIIKPLKSFALKAVGFLQGLFSILMSVGKFLFKAIDWLTKPTGPIAKFIVFVIKTFLAIKSGIKSLCKAAGKSSIDVLCMFLAGDMIGLALHAMTGAVKLAWDWLKKTTVFKFLTGLVKMMVSIGKLIFSLHTLVFRTIMGAVWQLVRGNFSGVIGAITKPWKDIWKQIKDLFSGKDIRDEMNIETLYDNPVEKNSELAKNTNISVRGLKMKGNGKGESNIAYFNRLQAVLGQAQYGDLLPRIQRMNQLYQENAKQVASYEEFIQKTWDIGQVGPDVAQQLLKKMLESPDISQKLLSVFFYYNPQTGETEMLRPASYIGQFLDNIRAMMSNPDRNDAKAFKTLIQAFDQLNKERSHIVNNQGQVIGDFAEKLAKFDQNNKDVATNGFTEISDYIKAFNKGDLFSKATAKSSFQQMADDRAKTSGVKSVTGSTLGTNTLLIPKNVPRTEEGKVVVNDKEFVMPKKAKEPPSRDKIGNVVLPPGSNPEPVADKVDDKSIGELWREHQRKRNSFLNKGHTDKEAHEAGLDDMTLDQFKQQYKKMHPKSPEEIEKEKENLQKRAASLRNAKMISAYHNQGKVASKEGFKLSGTPSIIQIETDGLSQTLYMFSPEWRQYYNATEISEDDIMLAINKDNKVVQERIRKKKEAEEKKKAEEAAQRRREQQILDYSAKVDGGFIEVKIGEDVQAMEDSYRMHMKKRTQFLHAGHTDAEAEAAGLKDYTWDEWKRYYRKMHGLPEDGIKRIPFEGKRKQRQIDWSARYPMSVDELAKYGIEVSEDGPVMIPLDKAMKAAGSLLANAKTIYSIRDGLEVMRQGLATETNKLKQQNKEGQPVAVAQVGGGMGGEQTQPIPPDQSHYSEVG